MHTADRKSIPYSHEIKHSQFQYQQGLTSSVNYWAPSSSELNMKAPFWTPLTEHLSSTTRIYLERERWLYKTYYSHHPAHSSQFCSLKTYGHCLKEEGGRGQFFYLLHCQWITIWPLVSETQKLASPCCDYIGFLLIKGPSWVHALNHIPRFSVSLSQFTAHILWLSTASVLMFSFQCSKSSLLSSPLLA